MTINQKITPCLWFNNNAEEAIAYYMSIFPNSRIISSSRYSDNAPLPKGTMLAASFELAGVEFMALNGGPAFQFTEAISLMVNCENQEEIDSLWEKLTADGGSPSRCGWLKDKYGLSWQIVPVKLSELLSEKNPKKSAAVMNAVMKMDKLIIADMENAYNAA
jgi:predicted 3-demethylubiquinone-9 3-methyltransferase (glyoxalase superfamily)